MARNKWYAMMLIASMITAPAIANEETEGKINSESEFVSDERLEEGFLTAYANKAIAKAMESNQGNGEEVKYGRKVTDYVSAPKIGGYFIGKYDYTDKKGANNGSGFSQRLVRFYVDGTILKDFAYRIQMQTNNESFHMKDFFLEWQRYKEARIKIGQFKRAFTFENPMNPWDVGTGDYSQLVKKLAGMGDFCGEAAAVGGRDQGIQVQGDLFPVGKDKHRLLHYQLMLANGQGINKSDANKRKDVIGTIQVQPITGLFIGFFGWIGNYTSDVTLNDVTRKVTVDRNRYAISAKYDANDWTVRAEYAHSNGHKLTDYVAEKTEGGVTTPEYWKGNGEADAWYATVGIPCTKWLKTYVKYDVYRDDASWSRMKSMYCIAPNIHLHKNLMFQIQYNFVNDRTLSEHKNYSELWVETYVRF